MYLTMAASLAFLTHQNMKIYILSWDGLSLRHQFDIVITATSGLDFQMNKEEALDFYIAQQAAEQTLEDKTMRLFLQA